MRKLLLAAALGALMAGSLAPKASAQINVYVGYLNNLNLDPNNPLDPALIPTPFDPDATTTLISSGGVNTPHDTGVIRFENLCPNPVTIDPGVIVNTQGATFQIWDSALPIVLAPGMNLVLAETANYNFDSSDFGLGTNPIVSGSINGMAFSFEDKARILLGHEEAGNFLETTPYGLLGSVDCVPEPGSLPFLGAGLVGLAALRRRRS